MTRPRALIFDLDGTLVDSRRDIADTCNAALISHGRSALAIESILQMVGDGARALIARAVASSSAAGHASRAPPTDALVDDVLGTFKARYLERPCVHTALLPGAREVVHEAEGHHLPCALVTNKPRELTLALLEALGMSSWFTAVWGGGDGPLKPAPDGVVAMLVRLDVAAADVWMIGDGPQDIGAGKAAGCYTVAVPGIAPLEALLASKPDLVCETLDDVRAELARLMARPA